MVVGEKKDVIAIAVVVSEQELDSDDLEWFELDLNSIRSPRALVCHPLLENVHNLGALDWKKAGQTRRARPSEPFAHAHHDVRVHLLVELDRFDRDTAVTPFDRQEWLRLRECRPPFGVRDDDHRVIQVARLPDCPRFLERSRVWEQGIRNVVRSHVGVCVGCLWRTKEGQPHHGSQNRVAIFAIVQQRDAEAVLGEISPTVPADLETGHVPTRVHVRRALDVAELGLERRGEGSDVQREFDFEELV